MKIGDKVRFIYERGGGVVTGFRGKDIVLVEGCLRACTRTPSPAKLVPSPYKQGESAIRIITPQGLSHFSFLLSKLCFPTPSKSPSAIC